MHLIFGIVFRQAAVIEKRFRLAADNRLEPKDKGGPVMKTLLQNGTVVNVFTGETEQVNVLIENDSILGVGDYRPEDADIVCDVTGKTLCPGFIDGHIHIESTMLLPAEFARVCVPHGTTSVVADPHEIANVCGENGIAFMLEASEGIPMTVYTMLPSCVPATAFDESGAVLEARDLEPFYAHPRVLGLAEMMNYPGVIAGDPQVLGKIRAARAHGRMINGHAPLLSGRDLDRYIAAGIGDDHECSSAAEAQERIRKGQRVMIRQGTAARNLQDLLPLFEEPWAHRCLLVTDDKHPTDLLQHGHIDDIIRRAAAAGKNPITGIRMATLWAAEHFGLKNLGAIAPGYTADLLVLDDLPSVQVRDVYRRGVQVVKEGRLIDTGTPAIRPALEAAVRESFHMPALSAHDFFLETQGRRSCRVIRLVPDQLITEEWITDIDLDRANGIDLPRDILKLAVVERHRNTGHKGIGFLSGTGLASGAIASSVSHDSHNLIVIGTNEADMAAAANRVSAMGGGSIVVRDGETLAEMPLPIAGLMTDAPAPVIAAQNERLRKTVHQLGVPQGLEPFMTMAFVSLSVIPHLKMTTQGLVDVDRQQPVPLWV